VRTLSSISSAVAVHVIGPQCPQSLFRCATNDSIALLRAFTEAVQADHHAAVEGGEQVMSTLTARTGQGPARRPCAARPAVTA